MNRCPKCFKDLTKRSASPSAIKRGKQLCRKCRKEYDLSYYVKNKKRISIRAKKYRRKHIEKIRARQREFYKTNRKRRNALTKKYGKIHRINIRKEVFSHYCKGEIRCQCKGCHVRHIELLTMDHRYGRKSDFKQSRKLKAVPLLVWLRKNNYPRGFQILCGSCNLAKGSKRTCPLQGRNH